MFADKQGRNGNFSGLSVSMPPETKPFQDGSIHCHSNFANQSETLLLSRLFFVPACGEHFNREF